MFCPSCGTLLGPSDRYCPSCGAPVNASAQPAAPGVQNQAPAQQPLPDPAQSPLPNPAQMPLPDPTLSIDRQNVSKGVYFTNLASDKVRKGIKSSAIVCYVCGGLTGLLGVLLLDSPFMLVDTLLMVILGVLIQVKQSRIAAIALLGYSLLNCVVTLIETGSAGGWLIIIAGVYAVKSTFALEKEYKAYKGQ